MYPDLSREISNFFKVWALVAVSLCYCYAIGKSNTIPTGTPRLLSLLPVVCLFLLLPLNLYSLHLGGFTAFFITWLANFKLLLFAFGKGPLSSSSLSLPRFLAVACLPIKIQQNPSPKSQSHQNGHSRPIIKPQKGHKSPYNYATKILMLGLLLRVYDYADHIHPKMVFVLYALHIYFTLEIMLAMVAALVRVFLGVELEQQFNEPYLSTSLQDFWGRRWNIMVTSILRPTVYEPVIKLSARFVPRRWAPIPAILATFVVSAIMHELIFYYLGRMRPNWEITGFFLLHGGCLMAEIAFKKALGDKWRLPRVVSTPLTVGFVMATGFWLFFPQLLRCRADERVFEEYAAVATFVKNVTGLTTKTFQFKLSTLES